MRLTVRGARGGMAGVGGGPGLIRLGTTVKPWGKCVAVGWVGERYYWFLSKGTVSMIPAHVVERKA